MKYFFKALQEEINGIKELDDAERQKVMEANRGLVEIAVKYTPEEIEKLERCTI